MDKCFTVREKNDLIEALIRWQDGLDGLVVFHLGNMSMGKLIMNDDDGYTNFAINIIKAYSTDEAIKAFETTHNQKVNGLASWHKDTQLAFVVVDKLYSNEEFIRLVMHEIGHLLGLEHMPSGTVMYKYSNNRPPNVTDADRHQLINAWRNWLGLN